VSAADFPEGELEAGALSTEEILTKGLVLLGLDPAGVPVERLARHLREIERWNPALGLVNACGRDLAVRHVLDSLAGVRAFAALPRGASVLDVGSGAGFPGVPLAVARPDLRFLLLDRSTRRCAFLEHCVGVLGLTNAQVVASEARRFRGPVDAVTFRAVSPLTPEFFRRSGIVSVAPFVVAYKGTRERVREEVEAVRGLYGSVEVVPVHVPFLRGERHLVLLRR
jgi:16S rRNA (guanine527-N7)-methyltransferase